MLQVLITMLHNISERHLNCSKLILHRYNNLTINKIKVAINATDVLNRALIIHYEGRGLHEATEISLIYRSVVPIHFKQPTCQICSKLWTTKANSKDKH